MIYHSKPQTVRAAQWDGENDWQIMALFPREKVTSFVVEGVLVVDRRWHEDSFAMKAGQWAVVDHLERVNVVSDERFHQEYAEGEA